MSSVKKLSETVAVGLTETLPRLRKTVVSKLSLAVAAVLEVRTANTVEIANKLPLDLERSDMREQWLRCLLSNPLMVEEVIIEPFAWSALAAAGDHGPVIHLSMDQTDIGNRFAILMLSVRTGDRALPLCWVVEAGAANIGFASQQVLLERVLAWLPSDTSVMLAADRFYPSADLLYWLQRHGWSYRLRLKSNLLADTGVGEVTTTGALAVSQSERYEPTVALFASRVMTAIGILHDPGHPEPWIIAMDCVPNRTQVLDYAKRWGIEPMFSDFKSRGFGLEETHLTCPQRLSRLLLIMALAMHWCVVVGQQDALTNPTSTEKKPNNRPTLSTGPCVRLIALCFLGLNAGYACYSDVRKITDRCQGFAPDRKVIGDKPYGVSSAPDSKQEISALFD